MRIVPAIIAKNIDELEEKIMISETFPGCSFLHIDIMDGKFVPNTTLPLEGLKRLNSSLPYEVHLMVEKPEQLIPTLLEIPVQNAIIHFESTTQFPYIWTALSNHHIGKTLALKTETPIQSIEPYKDTIDQVLLMSVEPGFYGNEFQNTIYERIQQTHGKFPKLRIEIDGGVTTENLQTLSEHKVDSICIGSRIYMAQDPRIAYMRFYDLLHQLEK